MKNNNNGLRFGFVLEFSLENNYGLMKVAGEPVPVRFTMDDQRTIVDGIVSPRFSAEKPSETTVPQILSQVVVAIRVDYELEDQGYRRVLRRDPVATGWNFLFEYKDSAARIAARPMYRIVQVVYWKGQPTSTPEQVLVEGTMEDLAGHCKNKPLPVKQMDFSYNYRLEEKLVGGDWKKSDDKIAAQLKIPVWQYKVSAASGILKPSAVAMPKSEKVRPSIVKGFDNLKVEVAEIRESVAA